jgi:hypothetical protein
MCDVSSATATEAELVVHAALVFFRLELAIRAKDVHDAGSLTSGAGGVGRTGRRLLLVLVLRLLLLIAALGVCVLGGG